MPLRNSPTDSPWFWASAFSAAALVALVLMGPRFNLRQPQLERQFHAREQGGQSVISPDGPVPVSVQGEPLIRLWPFYVFFTLLFVVTWSMWFWQRTKSVRVGARGK